MLHMQRKSGNIYICMCVCRNKVVVNVCCFAWLTGGLNALLSKITVRKATKTKTSNLLVHQGIDTSKTGLLGLP